MLAPSIKETTTTAGTGTLTLSLASGFARFGEWFAANVLCKYALLDSNGAMLEWGIGTYAGSNTLARTVVLGTYASPTPNTGSPTAVSLTGTTTVICAELMGGSIPGLTGAATTNGSSGAFVPEPFLLSGSASSLTITADRLYLYPVRIATPRKITAVKFRISSGGTGNAQIGFYKADETGNAKELTLSSGDIVMPASGVATWTFATSQVFPSDWVFVGFACKGVAPVVNVSGANFFSGATPYNTDATGVQPIVHKYAALTGGWTSLPSTAPSTGLTSQMTQPPLISLVLG